MPSTEDLGPQEQCGSCNINLLKFNHIHGRFAFKGKGCPQCGIEICSPEEKNPAQAKAYYKNWKKQGKPVFNKTMMQKMQETEAENNGGCFVFMQAQLAQFS